MLKKEIIQRIKQKGTDLIQVANRVIENPDAVQEIIEVIRTEKGSTKFRCEKVLRLVSERNPKIIYPHFDLFAEWLDSDNTFLKCGAVLTIANLTSADNQGKFEKIFDKYYSLVQGPSLIHAANAIRGSIQIALSKPKLIDKIIKEILKVEKADYENKSVLSPECKNVACGQAVMAFDRLYDKINDKAPVVRFVKRQLHSTRKSVAKSAEKFLRIHRISVQHDR